MTVCKCRVTMLDGVAVGRDVAGCRLPTSTPPGVRFPRARAPRPHPAARRELLVSGTPLAILVNSDDPFNAKTAVGVLRYSPDPIVGLVDPARAGKSAHDVYGVRRDVPIYPSGAALPPETGRLPAGAAPPGGGPPPPSRAR